MKGIWTDWRLLTYWRRASRLLCVFQLLPWRSFKFLCGPIYHTFLLWFSDLCNILRKAFLPSKGHLKHLWEKEDAGVLHSLWAFFFEFSFVIFKSISCSLVALCFPANFQRAEPKPLGVFGVSTVGGGWLRNSGRTSPLQQVSSSGWHLKESYPGAGIASQGCGLRPS